MSEQEKLGNVVVGLRYCIDYGRRVRDIVNDVPCDGCPYAALKSRKVGCGDCIDRLFSDTLDVLKDLLKEQEPVKPKIMQNIGYWCECGFYLGIKGGVKYCAMCGRAVRWE